MGRSQGRLSDRRRRRNFVMTMAITAVCALAFSIGPMECRWCGNGPLQGLTCARWSRCGLGAGDGSTRDKRLRTGVVAKFEIVGQATRSQSQSAGRHHGRATSSRAVSVGPKTGSEVGVRAYLCKSFLRLRGLG